MPTFFGQVIPQVGESHTTNPVPHARDSAIPELTSISVAPLTTTIREIPTEVILHPEIDDVLETWVANLDNIQRVHKLKIGILLATLSAEKMTAVNQALCFALRVDDRLVEWFIRV
jgi:mRNA interferase MazF